MLHFLLNKLNVVYIGVCNWGEVGHLQEVMPSLYGFTKEQDATNTKKIRWWVTPLFVLFITNWEQLIPFNKWPSNTPQLEV
jgi:hypothetical protein